MYNPILGFEEHGKAVGGLLKAAKPWTKLIREIAARWQLPEVLVEHQVYRESGFKPKAVSSRGAVGMLQLLPGTAAEVAARHGLAPGPLTDPAINIELGCAFMRELLDAAFRYTSAPKRAYSLALIGYLAGPSRIKQVAEGSVAIQSSWQDYVNKVIWDYEKSESWTQVKPSAKLPAPPPPVAKKGGIGGWIALLLAAGGVIYLASKKKKK